MGCWTLRWHGRPARVLVYKRRHGPVRPYHLLHMNTWSFDILRQTGWDLWVWVCLAASVVLVCYVAFGKLWTTPKGWVSLGLAAIGVGGTIFVTFIPRMHTPIVGMVWTFALLSILSATFYLNLQSQLGFTRTGILLGTRVIALAMLVPMLFEPVVRYVSRPKPERPLLFLIDTSGSMSFPDIQNGPTRLQSVWQTLRPQLAKINEHFIPQYFAFDTAVTLLQKPEELATKQADGKATDIVGGIAQTLTKSARDDASVVLISDGIDNTSPNVVDAVRASRRAVHTVRVGSEQAEPAALANVAVDNIEAPDDFTVDHET